MQRKGRDCAIYAEVSVPVWKHVSKAIMSGFVMLTDNFASHSADSHSVQKLF